MINHAYEFWLEDDQTPADPTGAPAGAAPPQPPAQPAGQQDPNVANQDQTAKQGQPQPPTDISKDPQAPDMPDQKDDVSDFETWKGKFIKESIQGDVNKMKELLLQVRDKEGLHTSQRKFVSDNWNILLLRDNANIQQASKQIRNQIRQQIDRNNPGTSVVSHLSAVLDTMPTLYEIFIKLGGYEGLKGDLHRKFIGALTGSVQIGSGGNNEDLLYEEKDYAIAISTRFNNRWGDVNLCDWSLKENDVQRYLKEPEIKRLQEGSPQERDALRKRIVIESIAELFDARAFIICVVSEDGLISTLGCDIATTLRGAFTDGKLVVKTQQSQNNDAMIDAEGNIVPLVDLSVMYVKDTDGQDEEGKPATKEVKFIDRRNGMLFLSADAKLIKESASSMQGMILKQSPYNGNPSDLHVIQRCVYTASDLLLRSC